MADFFGSGGGSFFGAYPDISSSTDSGGRTSIAQNYGMSDPVRPDPIDQFNAHLDAQAARMNAGRVSGGGGGGKAYNESFQQDPSGNLYDPLSRHWNDSPGFGLQQQQQAFKQQQWTTAFGALSGLLAGGPSNPYAVGGSNGNPPPISVGGVYNPQQIQQQVNASAAKSDQSTASQQRAAADEATGRGFASNSPLISAIDTALAGQNIGSKASSENQIRQTAAEQNAGQLLKTQTEAQNQWESANSLAIQRAKPYFDRQNALIAALSNLA